MQDWVRAAAVDDIEVGGGKLFSYLDKRIALFRTPQGVFANDNRCPHQGYALVRGDLKDGVLTCAWHNWKFELGSGRCLYGGENVRSYPVEVRGGQVFVDLADPPAEVVRYAAPRAEYGWDHSLATLTDCLRMSQLFERSLRALPVIQGLSVASENQVRRPYRPRPDPVDPVAAYGSVDEALRAFPALVEDEQADAAEGLFRGLLAAGVPPPRLRHTLLTAVTDHFLAYGHSMIFCQKAFEMLDGIGWEEADTILSPLVPEMVLGTRYDKLPYMRRFLRSYEEAQVDLGALAAPRGGGPFRREAYRRALTDGSPEEALGALVAALLGGADVGAVIGETGRAAAERLARFDIELDLDDTNEWGWLDVTHTLTYLTALRWAWSVDPSPEVLRGLFHAAWFVQWTGQFDQRDGHGRPSPHTTEDAGDVYRAIAGADPDAAVALVDGFAGPRRGLEQALAKAAAEDHSVAPIMVAHVVKTAQAAIDESRALGAAPDATAPIAAAARFLASPKRERFVFQATLEAISVLRGEARRESDQVRT